MSRPSFRTSLLVVSLICLAGMLCIEQNDEWLVGRGYLSAESISLVLAGPDDHTDKEEKEEVGQLQAACIALASLRDQRLVFFV